MRTTRDLLSLFLALFDKDKPVYLLVLFTVFSALSSASIILLVGMGIFRIYSDAIIQEAEHDSVSIAEAIMAHEKSLILSGEGERLHISPGNFALLDSSVKQYLRPFHMYKVKIFSSDRRVVYSNDPSIIGKVDEKNVRLGKALDGVITSMMKKKREVTDLEGETKFDVEVVETYLPIRDPGDRVIGAYEIYTDVSRYREQIRKVFVSSISVMFAVMFVAVGGLFLIMRVGVRQIERVQREIRRIAITDSLTGVFNRGHIMERLQQESAKALRGGKRISPLGTLGLIMIDIDHFKRINDTCGHQAGDAVLREIGNRLRSVLRTYDLVGRYGGEEFLAIIPTMTSEETKQVAERLWETIRSRSFEAAGRTLQVTVSIGVSSLDESEGDMEKALRIADQRLYAAKAEGRDRIVAE